MNLAVPYKRLATEDDPEEEVGEFQVAEYVIFLLALDTYMRYAEESSGVDNTEDDMIRRGIRLLRAADTQIDALKGYLEGHLSSNTHKLMLNRALNMRAYTPEGASRRALQFRTLLSRGGPSTMKGVFENQKYVRQVKEAISASMLDDADNALDVFAAIPMRNARMRDWIDNAAKQAGSGSGAPAPVDAASTEGTNIETEEIVNQNIQQIAATGAEDAQLAQQARSELLDQVERNATEAARKSLEVNQQSDEPPTRSEVVGLATAATVAALSDPSRLQNVPAPLRRLDDEQRAAALTDGRVRVAAGAGSGKSTTLVSRIEYLVKDRQVNPARIMACSFNRKAAVELKEKIASVIGKESAGGTSGVQVGTMHSIFAKLITGSRDTPGFGTPEERAMLRAPRLIAPPSKGEKTVNPSSLSATIRNMWQDCGASAMSARFGYKEEWVEEPPKAKKANLLLNAWRGNDVTLEEARKLVTTKAEAQAVIWYEMYMGLKGDIPEWKAPCPSKSFSNFMDRNRKGGERLGDLDDMLKILRDILKREPKAKVAIQGMFDHILVDEAQDLNKIQHQIFEMISDHIQTDTKDKSIWMVGDEKQAIYQFRGAKPELFQDLNEGWNIRTIRTNYRCQPEIIEAANKLMRASGEDTVESKPDPRKDRGRASIQVSTPEDNVEAALNTLGRFRKDIDEGALPENFAVLARTNAELNDFETACIINEIPYMRRGGRGFLEAPESRSVLGYIDLAVGNDYDKMKRSLVAVLMKPDRSLFLGQDDIEKAVDEALDDVARRERVDIKSIRPDLLLESRYVGVLADRLKQPYRLKIIDSARGDRSKGEWMYGKRVEELTTNLRGLASDVRALRSFIEEDPPQSTPALLNYVLDNMKSEVTGWDKDTRRPITTNMSLREQITNDVAVFSDDDEDAEEEKETPPGEVGEEGHMPSREKQEREERKGLGAVQFLYALAEPNKNDQENLTDPSVAKGFVLKLARYSKLADSLRIDPIKWEKDQQKILDEGKRKLKPPAITLSTCHSVKGLEWTNVTVLMPKGLFPMERKPKPDEPPPDPVAEAARMKAERNLAYVALTRAAVNLEVTCPMKNGISPFVLEAGLQVGENVPKPGQDEAVEVVKEAAQLEWYPEYE